jgi:hypothetical protein
VDCEIYNRSLGHAIAHGRHPIYTFIDCHVEGEVRLTDDILEEVTQPGFEPPFDAPEGFKISKQFKAGMMVSLGEDAFRAYESSTLKGDVPGEIKVLGCTVKNVRNAFVRGNYDKVFISNTTVLRHWGAFLAGGKTVKIVNCKVDLLYGAFLIRYGGTGHEVDLTLVPADPKFLPVEIGTKGASALINGRQHKIVLRRGGELRIKNPPPIRITGEEIELRNETGLPIELTKESRNCRIMTNGKVIDQGEGNRIESMR